MTKLFESTPDISDSPDGPPKVLCFNDEETQRIISTLSSDTCQSVFQALQENPQAAKDIAADLDTSVQTIWYHIGNLEEIGLIEVVDTCYSQKGTEMDIYGPVAEPHLIYLGQEDDWAGIRAAFNRFASAIGPVGWVFAAAGSLSDLIGIGD